MIRYSLILFVLGLSTLVFGQTNEDNKMVIQMSIDLDVLQAYYNENEVKGRRPLIICDNGVVPVFTKLTKFGGPVLFMTKKDLFFYSKESFLEFDQYEISSTVADVQFRYNIEGLTIMLSFEKVDGIWMIQDKKLVEN